MRPGTALLALTVAAACAPRPLVVRAIHARGGPLHSLVREAEAQVYAGFPGTWPFRTAFVPPDRYAWIIYTAAEPDSYLFDGTTARTFVGTRPVVADTNPHTPLRSHARFTAVANLDVLLLPGVEVTPLAAADVPAGAASGLAAVFADDGSRFRLGFDRHDLLVDVEGPLQLPPLGAGTVQARYADFRRTRGYLLPYRTSYSSGGHAIADERAVAVCPEDATLTREAFRTPDRIPPCHSPGGAP